jgi:predicted AAA+ superfamily ATPase
MHNVPSLFGGSMFEISLKEVLSRLQFDNPWWADANPASIEFSGTQRRKYFPIFLEQVIDRSVRRAVVLMGPRRVGKTVMVYHAIHSLLKSGVEGKNILYLSLETPLYTGLALERMLNLYLELHKIGRREQIFVFFDEVQYLKDWEVHLKSLVDSYPDFKFIVTGSAAAALRLKSNESGAGRFSNFILPPLTFAEYLQFIDKENVLINTEKVDRRYKYTCTNIAELNQEFMNYLNFGGYPEAVLSETMKKNPAQYIKSDIIDKVLLRDLPSLYGISDIQELNRLFTVLAYNTGNEVSLEDLSRSAGVAKNTIKKYLEYLEAAFLIVRVERIDNNARRFQRAMCFKVYLTNPSMRAALFGNISDDDEGIGNLVETAIFSQWQHSDNVSLYYARWATGEIDIVSLSEQAQKPVWATEIKWTDKPARDYSTLRHCVEFAKLHPQLSQPILCTTLTISAEVNYDEVDFVFKPSSLHAYGLGANLLSHKNSAEVKIGKTLASLERQMRKDEKLRRTEKL